MPLSAIYANLCCSDLARAEAWYTTLMGRSPDARPMAGLIEWHHGPESGLQIYADAARAGHGTVTLILRGLEGERARLAAEGLDPPEMLQGGTTRLLMLSDPDGNAVVLAEPQ
ncbi:MAG: glyoxalase/bleomycin resistance/dioxygenase family protein [Pseudomonadota bacterium]